MKNLMMALSMAMFLASCQSRQSPADNFSAEETPAEQPGAKGPATCYQLTENDQGIQATTFIILYIDGDNVTGEQAIEMTGKNYNAVAAGTMEGKMVGDVITVDYSYTIDGSQQVEEQEFKLQDGQLLMSQGELTEKDGKLMLKKKGLFNLAIPKIDCP